VVVAFLISRPITSFFLYRRFFEVVERSSVLCERRLLKMLLDDVDFIKEINFII